MTAQLDSGDPDLPDETPSAASWSVLTAPGVGRWALAATFLLPLVTGPGVYFPDVVPKAVLFRIAVTVAASALLVLLFARRLRPSSLDPVTGALVAFLVAAALASLTGLAPLRSVYGDLQRMFGLLTWFYLVVFFIALRVFVDGRSWVRLMRAAVVVGLVVGLLWLAGRNTIGNTGWLGSYLFLIASCSTWLVLSVERGSERLLWGGAAVAASLLLVAVGQRGPALALVVLVVGMGAYLVFRASGRRAAAVAVVLGAAIGAVALLVLAAPHAAGVRRLIGTSLGGSSMVVRTVFWRAGMESAMERPLLGYGLENFNLAIARNFPVRVYELSTYSTQVDRAHNVFIDALVATGVVGLICYLAFWVAIFSTVARGYRSRRLRGAEAALFLSATAGYAVYLLFWFEDHASTVLFIAFVAMMVHRSRGPLATEIEAGEAASRPLGIAAALVLGIVAYQTAVRPLVAADRAVAPAAPGRPPSVEAQLAGYERVAAMNVPAADEVSIAHVQYLRRLAGEIDGIRSDPRRFGIVDRSTRVARESVDRALERDPRNDLFWINRAGLFTFAALLHQDQESFLEAVASARRAIELAPMRLRHRNVLAGILVLGGRFGEAHAVLDESLRIFDRFGETHGMKARVYVTSGDPVEAARWLRSAWATGNHFGESSLVAEVAERLAEGGDTGSGAAVIEEYVRMALRGDRARGPAARMGPPMHELQAMAPLLWLRAGELERADSAAVLLTRLEPGYASEALRFREDLATGETSGWLERRALRRGVAP